jgi:hypothetical protein
MPTERFVCLQQQDAAAAEQATTDEIIAGLSIFVFTTRRLALR